MTDPGKSPAAPAVRGSTSRARSIVTGAIWGAAGIVFLAAAMGGLLLFMTWFSDPSGSIRVVEPRDGAVVDQPRVTIRGTSSPEWAGVYRVLGEGRKGPVASGENGDWAYPATLTEGSNTFKFHLDSHYGQSASVTIVYTPK